MRFLMIACYKKCVAKRFAGRSRFDTIGFPTSAAPPDLRGHHHHFHLALRFQAPVDPPPKPAIYRPVRKRGSITNNHPALFGAAAKPSQVKS